MNRHDAMRKIYEADPEAHEWRCRTPGHTWDRWGTSPAPGMHPVWDEQLDYEIRRRDGQPVRKVHYAKMRGLYQANPARYRWRSKHVNESEWSEWRSPNQSSEPGWFNDYDYEIEPIDPPRHRDGMPNAPHPPHPEDVFDPEKSPDHAPRWLVIGGGPQEYYSRESALQTAEEWSRSDPGRKYVIARVEAICETQPPVFSVREL